MDQIKTGKFIAKLRRERGMTQEALGGKLGVTNKTVSRWENGNYMPDIETLRALSKEFGVTMEELIDGERAAAPENEKGGRPERFTQEERVTFWKQNWKRENRQSVIFWNAAAVAVLVLSLAFGRYGFALVAVLFCFALKVFFYNKMMAYVERNAYKMKE